MRELLPFGPSIVAYGPPDPFVGLRRPTVADIAQAAHMIHGVALAALRGRSRAREIAWPRQQVMFVAKRLTKRSLPEIGRFLGDRDHTTVIHGIKAVEARLRDERGTVEEVFAIEHLAKHIAANRFAELRPQMARFAFDWMAAGILLPEEEPDA